MTLVPVDDHVSDADDVLQLPGLLLDFGGQEEGARGDGVAEKLGERVEHVEAVHVHDSCVDAQLSPAGRQQTMENNALDW